MFGNDKAEKIMEKAMLEKIEFLMQTDDSKDAPAEALNFARNIFRSQNAQIELKAQTLTEKLLAVLKIEWSPNFVFGERSANATQQVFVEADEIDIDLRIELQDENLFVFGQVLGSGFDNKELKLRSEDFSVRTKIGELGEFEFKDVPKGEYKLVLIDAK